MADSTAIAAKVSQRLREIFSMLTTEEKDVLLSPEGLTLRATLTRDVALAESNSPDKPEFGLYYNNTLRKIFRKKGIAAVDLIKPLPTCDGSVDHQLVLVSWTKNIYIKT